MPQTGVQSIKEAGSSGIMPDILAGFMIGFIEVIVAISLASLIFSGNLANQLPQGIAIALMTAAIITFVMSVMSSTTGTIAAIQDSPAVLVAVAITSIAPTLTNDSDLFPTIIMLITISTLLTGVSMWLLASFNLGDLVRYIPYPVIGGFLAGTGWLLSIGAIGTMADYSLSIETLSQLLQAQQIMYWIPGVVFSLMLFVGVRRFQHTLTLPIILVAGLIGLYIWIALITAILPDIAADTFLIGGETQSTFVNPLPYTAIMQADWSAIFRQVGNIAVLIVITAITLLLNISGIELSMQTDIDLNAELRAAGIANMVSGAFGGMIGFHTLSLTVLSHRVGARRRLTGIIAASVCIILLVVGSGIIALIPKAMLGGIILFLGLDFLDDWVIQGWRKFSALDFVVVILILGAIATWGYLTGMGLGLAMMVVIFVYKYSQINIFHHQFTGAEVTSNILRNRHHQNELHKLGEHIGIFELKGYIFFGTANRLLSLLRDRLLYKENTALQYLVLDFRRVSGLDSSAAFSFSKIKYLADMHHFDVIITHISDTLWSELLSNGLNTDITQRFDTLDYGLEWCEDDLLEKYGITTMFMPINLTLQLKSWGFTSAQIRELIPYLVQHKYDVGDYLIRQGDDAHDLYFIELGRASIMLESEGAEPLRIRTLTMGTVVGEISFFLREERSASVIADLPTIAYQLDRDSFQQMKVQNPELAIDFTELILRTISSRLVHTNRALVALNR